jgi:hypothetical protein
VTLRSPAASVLLREQHWFTGSATDSTPDRAPIRSWNLRDGSSEVSASQCGDQDCDPDYTFHGWSPYYRVSVWERDTNARSRIIKHTSSATCVFFIPARCLPTIFIPPIIASTILSTFNLIFSPTIHKVLDERSAIGFGRESCDLRNGAAEPLTIRRGNPNVLAKFKDQKSDGEAGSAFGAVTCTGKVEEAAESRSTKTSVDHSRLSNQRHFR